MDRPTQRPSRPYTRDEIAQKVYQHFVLDKAPKSKKSNAFNVCLYGGTGCAVGCMLTTEDADLLDAHHKTAIADVMHLDACQPYFQMEDLEFLEELQEAHDYNAVGETVSENILKVLKEWECNYAPSQS